VGCCIPPTCTTTIEQVRQAIDHGPTSAGLIVLGDLNVDLADPERSERDKTIAAKLVDLDDLSLNFCGRRGRRGGHTWSMFRRGRTVSSKTDYVLGTDCRSFRNVQIRDPRCNSDHFMVVASLWPATQRDHRRYVGGRQRFPIQPPKGERATEADKVLAELKAAMPPPEPRNFRRNALLLSCKKIWSRRAFCAFLCFCDDVVPGLRIFYDSKQKRFSSRSANCT